MSKTELKDKDLGYAEMMKRAREVKERSVKVGVLADGRGGAQHPGSNLTNAEIAAILEFGTEDKRIPARPALRMTFDAQREKLSELGKKLIYRYVVMGQGTIEQNLGILGSTLSADMKKTITVGAGVPPKNADSTIKRKGSSRPWVDTGAVVGAISYAVLPEGDEGESE